MEIDGLKCLLNMHLTCKSDTLTLSSAYYCGNMIVIGEKTKFCTQLIKRKFFFFLFYSFFGGWFFLLVMIEFFHLVLSTLTLLMGELKFDNIKTISDCFERQFLKKYNLNCIRLSIIFFLFQIFHSGYQFVFMKQQVKALKLFMLLVRHTYNLVIIPDGQLCKSLNRKFIIYLI